MSFFCQCFTDQDGLNECQRCQRRRAEDAADCERLRAVLLPPNAHRAQPWLITHEWGKGTLTVLIVPKLRGYHWYLERIIERCIGPSFRIYDRQRYTAKFYMKAVGTVDDERRWAERAYQMGG